MGEAALKQMNNAQKIAYIIDGLSKGVSRDVLADDLGYSGYKSMDIFLNRNGYKWNKQKQNYESLQSVKEGRLSLVSQDKAGQIIRYIDAGRDIKETAVLTGFGEVQSLATFMLAKGYIWDDNVGNYILSTKIESTNAEEGAVDSEDDVVEPIAAMSNGVGVGIALSLDEQFLLKQALPLLQQLLENRDTLEMLMNSSDADDVAALPRFTIPGRYMTKCVHMTDLMDQLVKDYSIQNNVSQKHVFEVALVEFFRKHGFDREINALLGI